MERGIMKKRDRVKEREKEREKESSRVGKR